MGKMTLKIEFIVAFCFHSVLSFSFDDVATIVDITEQTVSTLIKVPELVDVAAYEKNQGVEIPISKKHRQLSPILKKFAEVTLMVQKIDRDLKASNLQIMATLEKNIPLQYHYQMKMDSVEDTITLIDLYHQNFLSYIDLAQENMLENQINGTLRKKSNDSIPRPNMKFDRYTLENFAITLIAHVPTSVRGLMDRIHEMIVPSSNDPIRKFLRDGLFKTMLNTFNVSPFV